ncbi:undecaprenyl-diphosphatase/undecaprenyl-diphosphatase [Actinopolymorpha cephalotaxi]|uniref:Undecaprenyl-diphosphatase n=1 Tax=Actinopolymorpha cephalotaxi TaxID=504797 RepID=A0A1I2ZLF5_9ACTN|nr:phosphatase PAP2 family protein [Actinopolymorpha cephalotaxi]NYH82067.1 undecaprenyl-diphosphatase [Actinopolymorpha cephalotaxi]SFH38658.1 undecaprenyl-diphosphatase/undecaprenyl-diphosphatase [Actinopolymorpha cephalotaxi]
MGTVMLASAAGQLPEDPAWFRAVNAFSRATGWLHAPITAYAKFGVVLFALLLLWGWWTARGTSDLARVAAALWAPVGMLVAVGLNQPIVHGVHEARPYTALPHVLVLVSRSTDASFPSDHATMAGAVAAGLFLVSRRLGLVGLLAALVMAFARVYVGAHFPGDVLAGLLVGAAVSVIGFALCRRPLVWLVDTLARTPLRPLLSVVPPPETVDAPGDRVAT